MNDTHFRWLYAAVVNLAIRKLEEANAKAVGPEDWPMGQTWTQLGGTSRSTFMDRARAELGIPRDEFLELVRSREHLATPIFDTGITSPSEPRSIQRYVVGFYFNMTRTRLALIRKTKPAWQAGLLNGIGGKIELGETPLQAMVREFKEEGGVIAMNWREFCVMEFQGAEIYFFTTRGEIMPWTQPESPEMVEIINVDQLDSVATIPNLRWLVRMALDKDQVHARVTDPS